MRLATIGGASATLAPAWGDARPCAARSCALPPPDGSRAERDLPLPIQRACARLQFWRAGPFEQLAPRDRAVLAEIVRCVDRKKPQQAVYVRRDTLAEREGCSVPTITRALARLAGSGWITRDQVKSRIRGFQVGSVELSAEAVAWLGLLEPSPSLRESSVINASSDSGIQCIHRQPPAAGPSNQIPSKARAGQLPPGLAWLERHNLSRNGIYLLMGLARKRGVLLETVVNLCRQQIEAARMPFAYVRDLLAMDKDWDWLARSRESAAAAEGAESARQEAAAAVKTRLAAVSERWWFSPSKRQLLRLEGGAFMVYECGGDGHAGRALGARTDLEVVLAAIEGGRLMAWTKD